MKNIFLPLVAVFFCPLFSCENSRKNTPEDKAAIRTLLRRQVRDWNKDNTDAFMQAYWQSDSLTFIGGAGIV